MVTSLGCTWKTLIQIHCVIINEHLSSIQVYSNYSIVNVYCIRFKVLRGTGVALPWRLWALVHAPNTPRIETPKTWREGRKWKKEVSIFIQLEGVGSDISSSNGVQLGWSSAANVVFLKFQSWKAHFATTVLTLYWTTEVSIEINTKIKHGVTVNNFWVGPLNTWAPSHIECRRSSSLLCGKPDARAKPTCNATFGCAKARYFNVLNGKCAFLYNTLLFAHTC